MHYVPSYTISTKVFVHQTIIPVWTCRTSHVKTMEIMSVRLLIYCGHGIQYLLIGNPFQVDMFCNVEDIFSLSKPLFHCVKKIPQHLYPYRSHRHLNLITMEKQMSLSKNRIIPSVLTAIYTFSHLTWRFNIDADLLTLSMGLSI